VEQTRAHLGIGVKKESTSPTNQPPQFRLAQDEESQSLTTRLLAADSAQLAVAELDFEVLLRAAVLKSTN
jgi:hypothetical protein